MVCPICIPVESAAYDVLQGIERRISALNGTNGRSLPLAKQLFIGWGGVPGVDVRDPETFETYVKGLANSRSAYMKRMREPEDPVRDRRHAIYLVVENVIFGRPIIV